MRFAVLAIALVSMTACAKTKCEKYAEMEWRCGHYPAAEKEITMALSQGFCEAADSGGSDGEAMERFGKEGACAARFLDGDHADCAGYKACTDAIP